MGRPINKRWFGQTGTGTGTDLFTGNNLPIRVYNGSSKEGYIVSQRASRTFAIADDTVVQDEDIVAGRQYVIVSIAGSDFRQMGSPDNAVGRVFTATVNGNAGGIVLGNGTVYQVLRAKLVNKVTPTATGEACLVGITGPGGKAVPLRSISSRIATDFNGVRYKWTLQDDSTQTLLRLTAI